MPKQKTSEDYHELAATRDKVKRWLGPEVPNTKTKTWWVCKKGHKFLSTYNSIYRNAGCLTCWKQRIGRPKKTPEDYHRLAAQRSDISAWLGPEVEYISEKTWWQCANCGNKWEARYNTIQQGFKCLHCGNGQKPRLTKTDYIELAKQRGFKFIGPMVKNTKIKTWWQCTCGNKWACTYHNISGGYFCPNCTHSIGENLVAKTLKTLGFRYTREYTFDNCRSDTGNLLFFDFAVFIKNKVYLIEFDGEQHFRPIEYFGGKSGFDYTKRHDRIKNQFTKAQKIPLLRIPYYDQENIPSIVPKWINSLKP